MKFFWDPFASSLPSNKKVLDWLKLTGITGSTQVLIQGLGLLGGIVIIRLLDTEEYAYYTLANTMLGTMVVLADSGIASGVMAQAGKVWQDQHSLGQVLQTGLKLRRKFAVGSLILAVPILFYLLRYHEASWWQAACIIAALIPAFTSSLSASIYHVPLKLHQDIRPFQRNLVYESLARFILAFSLVLSPLTAVALLANGLPRMYANWKFKLLSLKYVDWNQEPSAAIRSALLRMVKRLMPGAVYYCISGQISIWLISFLGNTESVAQIGALGRIAMLTTLISSVFGTLIFPRFVRLKASHGVLLRKFIQIMGLLLIVCLGLCLLVWLFSSSILWVLGEAYSNLEYELLLSTVGSCMSVAGGAVFTMSTQRGWAVHPGLSIPVSVASIAVGAWFMNVSSLVGILYFNIFVASTQVVINVAYFLFKIRSKPNPS